MLFVGVVGEKNDHTIVGRRENCLNPLDPEYCMRAVVDVKKYLVPGDISPRKTGCFVSSNLRRTSVGCVPIKGRAGGRGRRKGRHRNGSERQRWRSRVGCAQFALQLPEDLPGVLFCRVMGFKQLSKEQRPLQLFLFLSVPVRTPKGNPQQAVANAECPTRLTKSDPPRTQPQVIAQRSEPHRWRHFHLEHFANDRHQFVLKVIPKPKEPSTLLVRVQA